MLSSAGPVPFLPQGGRPPLAIFLALLPGPAILMTTGCATPTTPNETGFVDAGIRRPHLLPLASRTPCKCTCRTLSQLPRHARSLAHAHVDHALATVVARSAERRCGELLCHGAGRCQTCHCLRQDCAVLSPTSPVVPWPYSLFSLGLVSRLRRGFFASLVLVLVLVPIDRGRRRLSDSDDSVSWSD